MEQVQTHATTTEKIVHVEPVATTTTTVTPVASTHKTYEKKKVIFRAYQIIWYILGVIEVLLTFRIILKALGANPLSGFVNFVYALSDPLSLPFAGIFGLTVSSRNIIEWSTFVAMLVYAIIAYGVIQLFQLIKPTNPVEVEQGVSQ